MKWDLNKDEEERVFCRKNVEDFNLNKKGKVKNVVIEEIINEKVFKYDKKGFDKFDRFKCMICYM